MATRDVQLRLTSTGLDKLVAQFSDLSKKIDVIIVKLDDISKKLDVLGAKKATPTVAVEGLDAALAKIALLQAALDDLGSKKATASVRGGGANALSDFMYNSLYRPSAGGSPFTSGMSSEIQRMLARDAVYGGLGSSGGFESLFRTKGAFTSGDQAILRGILGRESAMSGGAIDRGTFDLLGRFGRLGSLGGLFGAGGFFGAGGGLMRGAGAVGGAASSAGTAIGKVPWAGIGIGGGVGLLASMVPALVPTILGTGIGGAGVFGALKIASTANTNLQALQSTLQSAQQTYQQDLATGASPQQAAYDRLQMTQAQQAVTVFQKQNAPALRLYGVGQNLGGAASSTFFSALTSNSTRQVQSAADAHHGSGGMVTQTVGGTSFLAGITKTMGGLTSFMSSPAMKQGLGEMFRASLPFINLFVKSLEDFARIVGPAVVNMLKQFRPEIPIMRQGFRELSLGIADFIKYLGPGMKSAAIIFKTTMTVIRGLLLGLSALISGTSMILEGLGHAFMIAANTIKSAMTAAWHWVKTTFDQIIQGAKDILPQIEVMGKMIIQGLINGIKSMGGFLLHAVTGVVGMIPSAIRSLLHIASPSHVTFGLGQYIGEGLALGIDSKQGRVMSSAANLARGIPGAIGAGGYGGRGGAPLPITIQLKLNDDLLQVISKQIRVAGGDPRILIRKVQVV